MRPRAANTVGTALISSTADPEATSNTGKSDIRPAGRVSTTATGIWQTLGRRLGRRCPEHSIDPQAEFGAVQRNGAPGPDEINVEDLRRSPNRTMVRYPSFIGTCNSQPRLAVLY
jgi:hypothetical protein